MTTTANPFKGVGSNLTGAGAVKFKTARGTDRIVTVPDNFYLVCSCQQVFATGTTATGIHALVS
jgi:hypothetical protein